MSRNFLIRAVSLIAMALVIAYFFYNHFAELDAENKQLEEEVAGLEGQWVKLRQQQGESAYNKQKIIEIEAQVTIAQSEIAMLREVIDQRKKDIAALEEANHKIFLDRRKEAWRAAKGEEFDKVVTPQGKIYSKILITEVRPQEVSFVFGIGAQGHALPLHMIPEEWVVRYMYTEEEVKAAQAAAKRGVRPPKQP